MWKTLVCLASLSIVIPAYSSHTMLDSKIQSKTVKNMIVRLLGEQKAALFNVIIRGNKSDYDVFTLRNHDNNILITGNTGVAAAYGFHYYLKNYCKCHISWDSDQIKLPKTLPEVQITVKSYDRFRYYQNVCTYSYSFVWWSWKRWEREIDWMALNGINLALAFTGQEAVWQKVYRIFNMTDMEINEHFAGAGFLAWNRLGNIRGWGGPLSQNWLLKSVYLQHKIIKRMTDFGIIPILPGFCGLVPSAFKRLYPQVKMTRLPTWNHFPQQYSSAYFLDPSEQLFEEVGRIFMQELSAEYGLSHFYNCDPFNEMRPPNSSVDYLKKVSSLTYNVMSRSDPNSTWILQAWFFAIDSIFWTEEKVRSFLAGVPDDRMILLDLQSEVRPQYIRLKSYFGKPFLWCMLHNFGGTLGMHGSIEILNSRVSSARSMPKSTMIGTGITPEGIHQNYVVYDFMTEVSWRNESIDTDKWIKNYSTRRYGKEDKNLTRAWVYLKNSVYDFDGSFSIDGRYIVTQRPGLDYISLVWYDTNDLFDAWNLMLNVRDPDILNNNNFRYDVVDISRQVLQLIFDQIYAKIVSDFKLRNTTAVVLDCDIMSGLLNHLETLLSTNTRFMLGPWLHAAKLRSDSPEEGRRFQFNARNQISLWGPDGEIVDYATKQWSGVVNDYYEPRWQLFCKYLYSDLIGEVPFKQKIFDRDVFALVEIPFNYMKKQYPITPSGDSIEFARLLYFKWRSSMLGLK